MEHTQLFLQKAKSAAQKDEIYLLLHGKACRKFNRRYCGQNNRNCSRQKDTVFSALYSKRAGAPRFAKSSCFWKTELLKQVTGPERSGSLQNPPVHVPLNNGPHE